jgi:1-phosphofructokinase
MAVDRDLPRANDVSGPRVAVLAPSPLLTITVEAAANGDEVHIHAGGQGFWIARMISALGPEARLAGAFGGETGRVLASLIEQEGISLGAVPVAGSNGAYIHDRRTGERATIAVMSPPSLSRHELDDLYDMALMHGIDAGLCVLGGPDGSACVPAEMYERLAADLVGNGVTTVADLAGEALAAALRGGISLLKVSHDELREDGRLADDTPGAIVTAIEQLAGEGARDVVVSRADRPALALLGDRLVEVVPPVFEEIDHRGAGDSMTAGLAVGLASGWDPEDAVRLGAAAGALNVTRRGLATGHRSQIERLAAEVDVRPHGRPG